MFKELAVNISGFFFFQAEDGIRVFHVTGVQTCALPISTETLHPKNPIDLVGELKAPVLGLYGAADQGIPVASVEQMREAIKKANRPEDEIIVYPDTPQAFFADYRPSYHKDPAQDGWKRLLEWFKK